MIQRSLKYQFAGIMLQAVLCFASNAFAADITVNVATSAAKCSELALPLCYSSIQSAIDYASTQKTTFPDNTYSVLIYPGTYVQTFSLKTNISVSGKETARTIITGSGSGTIVTASNISNVSLRNLTFSTSSTGVSIGDNASVTINNNVFRSISGTAIAVQSGTISVFNNTFYSNGTAITRPDTNTSITNNIFSLNTTAISPSTFTTNILNNCFHNNTSDGPTGTDAVTSATVADPDPLLASIPNGDFHLKTGSPCIDRGHSSAGNDRVNNSTPDIGAYGGAQMDISPFPASVSSATGTETVTPSITLSWSANENYLVGGYKIHYGWNTSGTYDGTGATEGNSPVDAGNVLTKTLTGLPGPTPVTLTVKPVITSEPRNGALVLTWTRSTDAAGNIPATGYILQYGIAASTENTIPVGNVTTYTLSGLTNNQLYKISVKPYWQATYYIAITVYDTASPSNESAFSTESIVYAGPQFDGPVADDIDDYPEPIVPYPNLPNEGCFIATAAYGYYSAPQVQVLRDFRDRYLLANAPGRVFVRWYYTAGPVGARFLNEHSWLKPAVRVALLPAVGGAYFMTRTPAAIQVATFTLIILSGIWFIRRRLKRAHRNS